MRHFSRQYGGECCACLLRRASFVAPIRPERIRGSNNRRRLPSQNASYVPLDTNHPVFGLKQTSVRPVAPSRRPLLSIEHPTFGTKKACLTPDSSLEGPVHISGFFLSVDYNFAAGSTSHMNPNAQLTIRDNRGGMSRVRYRCYLRSDNGMKLELLVRFQVGWISPKVTFSHIPQVIHLGRGIDVSAPFLFHLTMVAVLDEYGDNTGSFLYYSGTPMLGFSAGVNRISGGRLVLDPERSVDPDRDEAEFIGHVHYRQLGFVAFKFFAYGVCLLACIPATQRALQYLLPDPFHRYSEKNS